MVKGKHHHEDFIREAIRCSGVSDRLVTRFPPEPNGFLHIGHAKSMCLNFGVAHEFGGRCHMRFDDTNPRNEDKKFINSIQNDVRWLGFKWENYLYFASDHFEQLYEWAEHLILKQKAYVDDLSQEQIRLYRGTLTTPGRPSPFRNRTARENLDLFRRMRKGDFADGSCVLRALIDMSSANVNMRDPVLYRILHVTHPRTGGKWCIYPTYDFAHGQSDAIEGVTHSLCTTEFEDHRPLYNWFIENLPVPCQPKQYEFARLNLSHTVLSKRQLTQLVDEGYVNGWDDPRLPTLAGMRRRGVPPSAIHDFIKLVGIKKSDKLVDLALLEHCIRNALNRVAPRRMVILDPIELVVDNYPQNHSEQFVVLNNPQDPDDGSRNLPFSRRLYIERNDFTESPAPKFYRLSPGQEVRLRNAYLVTCNKVIKDTNGSIVSVHCTYDPHSRGGDSPDGRKVRGTVHWVSAEHSVESEVRLYNPLLISPTPNDNKNLIEEINPRSLEVLRGCKAEILLDREVGHNAVQFERHGYFCHDIDSRVGTPIFNRTVALRDTWSKINKS